MIIFLNNMKRLLRKRLNLVFMIVVPVVLISFISYAGGGSRGIKCGIVDNDNTPFTLALAQSLDGKCSIVKIDEDDVNKKIFGQLLDVVIIMDEGLTDKIISNEDVHVKAVSLQETNLSMPVDLSIENFMNAAANIALEAGGDKDIFYEGMSAYQNAVLKSESYFVDSEGKNSVKRISTSQLGFLVMGMIFLPSLGARIMIEDKQKKVYYRILSGSMKVSDYMLQSLLSFFAMSALQILLIFTFMAGILKMDFGANFPSIIIASLFFSLCSVALGVAINTVSSNMRQSGLITSLLLSPMCMLGGAWWPMEIMPELLQKIALFVPVTWIMKAYEKILQGNNFSGVISEISAIVGFTVLFSLLASWKRVDVAK